MRMLDDLKDHIDEIESRNEWEHKFVSDILVRKEENPEYKLSPKQFEKLNDIHKRYVLGW